MESKVSTKGQTVIPQALREQYNLEEGSLLEWKALNKNTIIIKKVTVTPKKRWSEWAKKASGLHKEMWSETDPLEYQDEIWGI